MVQKMVDCLETRMDRRKEITLVVLRVEMKGGRMASQLVVMMVSWSGERKEMKKVDRWDRTMVA